MFGRDDMLTRIRQALRRGSEVPDAMPSLSSLPDLGAVMPGISPAELLDKFEAELRLVGGEPYRVRTLGELGEVLGKILTDSELRQPSDGGARSVVLSRNPLLVKLGLSDRLSGSSYRVAMWPQVLPQTEPSPTDRARGDDVAGADREAFKERCFEAGAGITGADFALAESGSLVLSSLTEGSQLSSLAPPVHVALYRRHQLIASLEELLERASSPSFRDGSSSLGRSLVFITGTSRTADIEQILIRGVHGPREVHAILVEESCLTSPA